MRSRVWSGNIDRNLSAESSDLTFPKPPLQINKFYSNQQSLVIWRAQALHRLQEQMEELHPYGKSKACGPQHQGKTPSYSRAGSLFINNINNKKLFCGFWGFFSPSLLRHRTTKTQALKGSRNLFAAFSLILPKSWLGFNPSLLLAAMHYPEPAEFLWAITLARCL